MFKKIFLKDEKYRQIYEDILLNTSDIKKAKMYTLKQFLIDNYNYELKKVFEKLKSETNDTRTQRAIIEDTLDFEYANKYMKKQVLKKELAILGIGATMIFGLFADLSNDHEKLIEQNAITYEKEIDEYNQQLDEYVNSLDLEGLTDLEIFMLVMNDMWESIEGYGNPELDVHGYTRLDIKEGGVGVCRNIADDMTAKLNAINPEYNARNLIIHCEFGNLISANIERHKTEEYIMEEELIASIAADETIPDKIFGTMVGNPNHMVTLVDIPGKDITLVLDPTNALVGVFRNGQIIMFNDQEGIYDVTKFYSYLYYGDEDTLDLTMYQLRSFNCDETIEELEEQYGLDAQNEALENVRQR